MASQILSERFEQRVVQRFFINVQIFQKMKTTEKSKAERRFDVFCYVFLSVGALYFAAHTVLSLLQKGGML
jgi:hypothetical protein